MSLKRPKGSGSEYAGTLVVLEHDSKILRGNPLGDPHIRKLGVWLPPLRIAVVALAFLAAAFQPAALAQARKSAATPAPVKSAFPGDDALTLAGDRFEHAGKREAQEAIDRVLDHLRIPPDRRDNFSYVAQANFRKAADYAEFKELSETVLIAAKSVKIAFARNVVVISGGSVDVAHGAGMLVVAAGDVSLAHESDTLGVRPPDGLYVTKGRFDLSHGERPGVYAVKGASTGNSSPFTYNTDAQLGSGRRSTAVTLGPLFRDEPLRTPAAPSMRVSGGETMPFDGARCKFNIDLVDLHTRLLPMARRDADCPRLQSASVRCEQDGAATAGSSRERWTFVGCGNRVDYNVSGQTNAASIGRAPAAAGTPDPTPSTTSISRAPAPAATPAAPQVLFTPPGGKLGETRSAMFKEALGHVMRGELLEARAKYQAAFDLTGNDPFALSSIANLDRRIASVDAKVAPYTKVIEGGNATARDFANRGLAYVHGGDVGRGLKDLVRATEMNSADPQLRADLARGYLLGDRLDEAHGVAHQLTADYPKQVSAYEVSAWAQLLSNTPDLAYKAAFSSLVEAPPWSKARFASEKAAYRVLAGYFALRACNARPKANAWTRQWVEFLSPDAWPDAMALHLVGDLDEHVVLSVASSLKSSDAGLALGEAYAFLALEELFAATGDRLRKAMSDFFSTEYGAGRTLAWLLRTHLIFPDQRPRLRTPSEPQCFS